VVVYGVHPVFEALRSGRVTRVRTAARSDRRVSELVAFAEAQGVPVERVPQIVLDRLARGGVHQGVVADLAPQREYSVIDLVREARGAPLLVVLDGIEDPRNVGAILRTADAAGADGVVRQIRRAAPLDGAAAKVSAGAIAYVRVAAVVNIARALEELKAAGVWTVGLTPEAPRSYEEVDYTPPTALVLGAEGKGLRRLVRDRCDWLVQIPMRGHVASLNVAVAAGIVLFEAVRQRRRQGGPGRPPSGGWPEVGRSGGEGVAAWHEAC
jgi:23S rRNA (guanosine2251-2'-O)-methyltransferase